MKMNLILIVIDCLRPDFLGCYGNKGIYTPTIDRLANQGALFEQAITSAPWTMPSLSSIASGISAHKLRMFEWRQAFPSDIKTIFHYLRENNYEVASFVSNEKTVFANNDFCNVLGKSREIPDVLGWIENHSQDNFFLFLHYWGVHAPYFFKYSAEAWYEGVDEILKIVRKSDTFSPRIGGQRGGVKLARRLYANAVERMSEEFVSAIVDKLTHLRILDDTLIIITADHGDSWGERIKDKTKIDLFSLHGAFLYDEILKVPLIFSCPAVIPTGRRIKHQVRSIDIFPTILDALNIPLSHENFRSIDGISLKPMIYDKWNGKPLKAISSTSEYSLTESDRSFSSRLSIYNEDYIASSKDEIRSVSKISLRTPEWKLIWNIHDDDNMELYNLQNDPKETQNQIGNYPELEKQLISELEEELKFVVSGEEAEEERKSIKTILRGLGYL